MRSSAAKGAYQKRPEIFLGLSFDEGTKKKVLWDNYAALYHLPEPEPMTPKQG